MSQSAIISIAAAFMLFCSSLLCSQFFCSRVFEWGSGWCLKTSSPSCPCEASLMAFVCMHILYLSGGSSSAHLFSCHRWKRLRDGERTTISLLWRYFLYKCTSSNPQPLMVRSKPPEREKIDVVWRTQLENVKQVTLKYFVRLFIAVRQR